MPIISVLGCSDCPFAGDVDCEHPRLTKILTLSKDDQTYPEECPLTKAMTSILLLTTASAREEIIQAQVV